MFPEEIAAMSPKTARKSPGLTVLAAMALLAALVGAASSIAMCRAACSSSLAEPLTPGWRHSLLLAAVIDAVTRPAPLLVMLVATLLLILPDGGKQGKALRGSLRLLITMYGSVAIGLATYAIPLLLDIEFFASSYSVFSLAYSAAMLTATLLGVTIAVKIIREETSDHRHTWARAFVTALAILFMALTLRLVTEAVLQPVSGNLYHCSCNMPKGSFIPIATSERIHMLDISTASLAASWVYAFTLIGLLVLEQERQSKSLR